MFVGKSTVQQLLSKRVAGFPRLGKRLMVSTGGRPRPGPMNVGKVVELMARLKTKHRQMCKHKRDVAD